jgi:hypothetical protein
MRPRLSAERECGPWEGALLAGEGAGRLLAVCDNLESGIVSTHLIVITCTDMVRCTETKYFY